MGGNVLQLESERCREEGVAMGEKRKAVESAQNLIKEGLPVELIARAVVLPVAEVIELKNQMS